VAQRPGHRRLQRGDTDIADRNCLAAVTAVEQVRQRPIAQPVFHPVTLKLFAALDEIVTVLPGHTLGSVANGGMVQLLPEDRDRS
jgi:hypothetical protein